MVHHQSRYHDNQPANQSKLGTTLTEGQKRDIEKTVLHFLNIEENLRPGCKFSNINDAYDKFTLWNDALGGYKHTGGFVGISKTRFRRSLWHLNERGEIRIRLIREVEPGVSGFGLIDRPKLKIQIINRDENAEVKRVR